MTAGTTAVCKGSSPERRKTEHARNKELPAQELFCALAGFIGVSLRNSISAGSSGSGTGAGRKNQSSITLEVSALEASASISTIRSRGSSSRQSAEPAGEPAELQRSRGREPHEPRERDGGLHLFFSGQCLRCTHSSTSQFCRTAPKFSVRCRPPSPCLKPSSDLRFERPLLRGAASASIGLVLLYHAVPVGDSSVLASSSWPAGRMWSCQPHLEVSSPEIVRRLWISLAAFWLPGRPASRSRNEPLGTDIRSMSLFARLQMPLHETCPQHAALPSVHA